DGRWVSFISDRTGEDELYIQQQDGTAPAKQLTKGGGAYKFDPVWSPDSKYLLYGDRSQHLYAVDVQSGNSTLITQANEGTVGSYTFAPDSKWIAYTLPGRAREFTVINLFNLDSKKTIPVTDTWYNSGQPEFSSDGKLLYFVSQRDFSPTYGSTGWNHVYNDMSRPYFVRLSAAAKSPYAEKSDEVSIKDNNGDDEKDDGDKKDKASTANDVTVTVDGEGLADRIESLPVTPGSYLGLVATDDGLYYSSRARGNSGFKFFSLEDKKETDIGSFGNYSVTTDRKKILIRTNDGFFIENLSKSKI